MEGRGAAEGPEVCDEGRLTNDQGSAGETRELGGAVRTTVTGGVEAGRSPSEADWSMGRGEVTGLAA